MEHLILNLEAPLMAFGGETIDNRGVTRRFPSASMLTGLFANALGWRRTEAEAHQRLQDRLVFAALVDREPAGDSTIQDFQTAAITNRDQSWTTRGAPEGRAGGSYVNWLRYRDYLADARVTVGLRLEPVDDTPTLEELAAALVSPARPLFIGRKPCLPSAPLFSRMCDADSTVSALIETMDSDATSVRLMWPAGDGDECVDIIRTYMVTDERNWISGLHGGGRLISEGTLSTRSTTGSGTPP